MNLSRNILADKVKGKKVVVGLSGGVDSAVSAYLLKEADAEVVGVYIQCWDFKADGCKAEEDRASAVETAAHLGIKFNQLDFRNEYKEKVMEYFYTEYKNGRTPNPDVMCNKEIKFGLFYKWALENGFDFVATGHYARIEKDSLLKGVDVSKDQSYFLYEINNSQLSHILFPVGHMLKSEVKEIAQAQLLPPKDKPESMGICFIGEVDIKEFLKKQIEPKKGNVLDLEGKIIGEHEGIWFYTIGQRHGFKINKYFGEPLYVLSKDVENNILTVGLEKDAYRDTFEVVHLHWLSNLYATSPNITVRIRHLGKLYPCSIELSNDTVRVSLKEKAFGIASGQSAVFYQDDLLLGGGTIV